MCNILKTTDRRETDENLGLAVLCTAYVGYFSCLILEFTLGSFGALCKLPDVNIFRLLLPQFSSNFNQTLEKACNPGKCRPFLFLSICQITSATLPLSIKLYLVHLANGETDRQGPWASCYSPDIHAWYCFFTHRLVPNVSALLLTAGKLIYTSSIQLVSGEKAGQVTEQNARAPLENAIPYWKLNF